MAATDATPIPVKNQAYRVTFPILDADGDLVAAATGLDSEVSKDGGTFTDCTSEATEIATGSGMYFLDLTNTEMNADTVAIIVKTTSSGAKTTPMVLYPNKSGGLAVNVTAWAGNATTTGDIAIKTTLAKTTHITGFNDLSAANVQTELNTYGALKPTAAGRTLDVTTTGEAGVDFDNTVGTLVKGTDITGFNDLSTVQVQTELTTYGALKPTVAARTLDVSATGEAGIDWANIGAPTTTVALTGTTVGTVTNLTNDPPGVTTLLTRISSTIFSGITSLKEWLGMLAGKQVGNATARTELRSSGAGAGTFDETTDSQEALRDRGDAAWITGAGGDPWLTAVPGAYAAGTAGNILGNRLDVAVSTRATPTQVQTELGTYGALKPTVAARTLDVSTGGEAGVDWANIGAPTTTVALTGTTVGTTTNLTNTVGLTPTAIDNVWAKTMTELAAVPGVTASVLSALQWMFLLSRNKITQTATTQLVRNDADSATIGTSTVSDDGTTFTRNEFS